MSTIITIIIINIITMTNFVIIATGAPNIYKIFHSGWTLTMMRILTQGSFECYHHEDFEIVMVKDSRVGGFKIDFQFKWNLSCKIFGA